jgi:hypothetical protein
MDGLLGGIDFVICRFGSASGREEHRSDNRIGAWIGFLRLHMVSAVTGLGRCSHLAKNDYFVRVEGAAQRPLGFHNSLSSFLGWQLPTVSRFDGSDVPLYLECIFPLFIVEQKHGW